MRDESDDEVSLMPSEEEVNAAVAAKESGHGGSDKHGAGQDDKEEKESQKLEVVKDLIKKRQAQVGEVELHPDISMSTPPLAHLHPPPHERLLTGRLYRLYQRWTRTVFQSEHVR